MLVSLIYAQRAFLETLARRQQKIITSEVIIIRAVTFKGNSSTEKNLNEAIISQPLADKVGFLSFVVHKPFFRALQQKTCLSILQKN